MSRMLPYSQRARSNSENTEIITDVKSLSKMKKKKEKNNHLGHYKDPWHGQIWPYIINCIELSFPRSLAATDTRPFDLAGFYYIEL